MRLDDEHVSEMIAHGQTGDHLSACQHLVLFSALIFDIDKVQKRCKMLPQMPCWPPCAGWSLDLAVSTSTATKTFTGSYGKKRYGTEGLSMAGPVLLDAPVAMRRTGLTRLLLCKFEIRLLGS